MCVSGSLDRTVDLGRRSGPPNPHRPRTKGSSEAPTVKVELRGGSNCFRVAVQCSTVDLEFVVKVLALPHYGTVRAYATFVTCKLRFVSGSDNWFPPRPWRRCRTTGTVTVVTA
jgi:hypothetical protein